MKYFKQSFSQIFKGVLALTLFLSIGSVTTTSSARRVNHSHVRINRQVPRRHRRTRRGAIRLRKRHINKQSWRLSRRQIKQDCSEIDRQTISDVNNDRRHNRLPKLKLNHQLSKIGDQRTHQLQKYFSHNTPQHFNEVQYLLNRKAINYKYYGENIASSPLGEITMLDVGPYNTPTNATRHYLKYHAKNGYQLANNINNASMDHDEGDNNGHRANDLDRQFKQMGVGVSYSHHDKNFYIAIEFIG